MSKKTCFVISPIGEDGTEVRKHADDFLELLVEPALARFGFDVIRADKIARSSVITNDIVELVQQSDLCLVDLTYHNPNVFYECGRRHETGRPTIQLIRKGEKLPFDVAGIRTLEYNLNDARSTLDSVKKVIEFVAEVDAYDSYGARSSGASLTTIAATLARIEKKLGSITSDTITPLGTEVLSKKQLITMNPIEAILKAMEQGDISSARFVLPRVKKFLGESYYVQALSLLAEAADESSKDELLEIIPSLIERQAYRDVRMALLGLTDFYTTTASESLGAKAIENIVYSIAGNEKFPNEERAYAYNRIQMLKYQAGEFSNALLDALKAVELCPNNDSYLYNLSLIHRGLEKYDDAANSIVKFLEFCDSPREGHLEIAHEILIAAGREDEYKKLLEK